MKFHLFTRKGWLKSFITRNASLFKENSMGLVNLGLGDYKKIERNEENAAECACMHKLSGLKHNLFPGKSFIDLPAEHI